MDARTRFASRQSSHGASCALHLAKNLTRLMGPALSHHNHPMTATTFYLYAGGDCLEEGHLRRCQSLASCCST